MVLAILYSLVLVFAFVLANVGEATKPKERRITGLLLIIFASSLLLISELGHIADQLGQIISKLPH